MSSLVRFRRQTIALFMIVSLIPALVVGAIWYVLTQVGPAGTEITYYDVIVPVFLVGLVPAFVLSFLFAEILSRPVRQIHAAALRLAAGDFTSGHGPTGPAGGEFAEVLRALSSVSSQLERALSESTGETRLVEAERNKLQGVLNSMTDGVFALDQSGRIILFNRAASTLTGRPIAEVAGQLAEKVMPFRLDGELVMARWLATRHGSNDTVGRWRELELYRGDGTSLFVAVQAVVLTDDPNGIRALVTFHDLTHDHELEEMKVDFVALAAHELRTPITEIKGYLDIIQHEAVSLTPDDRTWLERSVTSVGELSSLVNNLLNVARIEHDEVSMTPRPTDYAAFLHDLSDTYRTLVERNGHHFVFDVPATLPAVMADTDGIREVLNNYISNACVYTPAGGTITLAVKPRGREVDTVVRDTGRGIPPAAQGRLFHKFYRVSEFKARTRGTGLGLYISKSIIEAHRGHVWVESQEGEGSTFGFSLRQTKLAPSADSYDNNHIMQGTHGWIKKRSVR